MVIFSLVLALASIGVNVFGFMILWDINLDVVSIISLIMCIGFSVDFCAHICHSYFHSEENSPAKKVEHSLTTYGLPVTQGAISTMLGVTPFFFIDSYILQTFAKMVILVAAFGLFHGILVIPTFLMIFGGAAQSTGVQSSTAGNGSNSITASAASPARTTSGSTSGDHPPLMNNGPASTEENPQSF